MVRQFVSGKFSDYNASSPTATLTAEDADYEVAIVVHHNADQSAEIVDASASGSESGTDANNPAALTSDRAAAGECETKDSQPSDDAEAADQQQLVRKKQTISTDEDSSDDEDTCVLLATTEDSGGDAGGADSENTEADAECEGGEMELVEEDQEEAAGQEDQKPNAAATDAKAEQESQASATTEEEKKKLMEEEKQQRKLAKRERKRVKRIAKKVAKKAAKNDALFPKRPNPDEYLMNVRVENHPKW